MGDGVKGGDIDHCDMMKVIMMPLVMMSIWMTAEVLMLTAVLESVIVAHSPGWKRVFGLTSDIVNT